MQYWIEDGVGICLTNTSSALANAPTSAPVKVAMPLPAMKICQCLRYLLPVVQTQPRLHTPSQFDDLQVLTLLRAPFGRDGAELVEIPGTNHQH